MIDPADSPSPSDSNRTAQLLMQLLESGTATRYDRLDAALREAEQRGANLERARIRGELQTRSARFISDLARYQ